MKVQVSRTTRPIVLGGYVGGPCGNARIKGEVTIEVTLASPDVDLRAIVLASCNSVKVLDHNGNDVTARTAIEYVSGKRASLGTDVFGPVAPCNSPYPEGYFGAGQSQMHVIKMAQHLDSRCVLLSDPST